MKNMICGFLFVIILGVTSYFSFRAGFLAILLFILLSILIGTTWLKIIEKIGLNEKNVHASYNGDALGNRIFRINIIGLTFYILFAVIFLALINYKAPIFGEAANERIKKEQLMNQKESKERNLNRLAREYLSPHLKDPNSAEFRNQKGLCGEVNSNNSFGGKVGYQRFIVGYKSLYILERESGLSPRDFQKMWDELCE